MGISKLFSKCLLPIVLVVFFIFLSSGFVFADVGSVAEDSLEDLPQSALLSTVTDPDEIELDNTLRQASSLLAASSTTYTADDIYNLLISIRTTYGGSSYFRVIDPQVTDLLTNIYTRMALYQSSLDNLISSSNSLDSTLDNIYDSLGAGTSGYNVLYLLDSILNQANAINDNLEYNDGTTVQGLGLMVQYIQRYTNSINNNVSVCKDHLQSITFDLATIHSYLNNLQTSLDTIHNDNSNFLSVFSSLDNLSWTSFVNNPILGYSYTVDDALSGTYFTPSVYPSSYNDFYVVIDSSSLYNKALKFDIPFYSVNNAEFNIDFKTIIGNKIFSSSFDDILFFNNNSLSSTIIVYGLDFAYSSPNKILMHITPSVSSQNIYFYTGTSFVSYLNFDSMDYQYLSMALSLRSLNKTNHSDLMSIDNSVNNVDVSINNTSRSILSQLDKMDNLNWTSFVNNPILGYSYTVDDALSGTYFTPSVYPSSYNDFYVVIDSSSLYNKALKFDIPFYSVNNAEFNIDFKTIIGNKIFSSSFDDILFFNNNSLSSTIIVYGLDFAYSSPNKILMHITPSVSSQNIYFYTGTSFVSYLNFDSMDYQYLSMALSLRLLSSVYASPDLIAAKKAQQNYEDTALSDFTGSGSASASTSDLGSLNGASATLKSGLDTGASVSDGFSVFNPNSSLWGWFSQRNYNEINNLYVPDQRNLFRGSSVSDIDTPYLDNNTNEFYNLLGGDNKW